MAASFCYNHSRSTTCSLRSCGTNMPSLYCHKKFFFSSFLLITPSFNCLYKSFIAVKNLTKFKLPINIQIIPFEINLRKEKWLFVNIYKPPSQSNQYFLDILGDLLDFYSQVYDNNVILGNFNLEPSNPNIVSFMNNQNLLNLVKDNTCFEGKGSSFDLILTNRKYSFKNTCSVETRLSDHHHLIYNLKNLKN